LLHDLHSLLECGALSLYNNPKVYIITLIHR